jgi:TonB family protein
VNGGKLLPVFVLVCGLLSAQSAPSPEPVLKSAGQPRYSALARAAHIEGEVRLEFVLDHNGDPSSAVVLSGHPMLASSAVETVKTWNFEFPENAFQEGRKYETTFAYQLSKKEIEHESQPKVSVAVNTFHHVEIMATWADVQASDCPAPETQAPVSTGPQDFVELFRSGCYGSCPVYTVRIAANGDVSWKGRMFVNATGERRATLKAEDARALLERFRTPQFWSLCGSYTRMITDSSTIETHVEIGGQGKTVSNYADSAPAWVAELEDAIDEAANTYQWRHGDSRTESLSHIFNDAYMPKPGVTSLMRAAEHGDVDKMRALLKEGARISDADASGWTPLMYAAASSSSPPVQLLLQMGADPNQKSAIGDTALMASAINGAFDDDPVKAGASINAQNSAGVTALMILAARGEADEIRDALKAGANASLKDSKGRTALDYLRLANCGKSPIRDEQSEWVPYGKGKCRALDADDFTQAEKLLKAAVSPIPTKKPDPGTTTATETVDLTNGNLHLTIPVVASKPKQ